MGSNGRQNFFINWKMVFLDRMVFPGGGSFQTGFTVLCTANRLRENSLLPTCLLMDPGCSFDDSPQNQHNQNLCLPAHVCVGGSSEGEMDVVNREVCGLDVTSHYL